MPDNYYVVNGVPNHIDSSSDVQINSKGINDMICEDEGIEAFDNISTILDFDCNNDGVIDISEAREIYSIVDTEKNYKASTVAVALDTDGDGVDDVDDFDDDNDGILDTDEGCTNIASTPSGAVVASDGTGGSLTLINDEDFAADNGIALNGAGEYIIVDLGSSIPSGVDVVFTLWKNNDNNKTLRFAQLSNTTPNLGGGVNPATVNDTDIAGGGSVTSYTYTLSADTRYVQVEMTSRNAGRIEIIEATIQSYALCSLDTDGDGIKNNLDIDSDGDGIVDLIESQATTGSPVVPVGTDTDGDGIDNAFDADNGGTPITPVDTDGNGTPDYLDLNSDGDSFLDALEGWDTDGDKVANTTPTGTDTDGDGLDNAYDDVVGPNATTNVYNNQDANDFPDVTTSGVTSERDWREANPLDSDLDGIIDNIDIDDDNDGILDKDEAPCDTPTINFDATPEAYWTLENNTNDVSGNGHNERSAGNAPGFSTTAIQGTYSASFNGTSHEIRYSQDGAFMESAYSTISFSAWIRPTNLSGDRVVYEEGGATNGFMLWLDDGVPTVTTRTGGPGSEVSAVSDITLTVDNTWHHVAAIFDKGEIYVYVDGKANTATAGFSTVASHGDDGGIGGPISGAPNGISGNYAGLMDAVRYDNSKAWSASRIGYEAQLSCDTDGDGVANHLDLDSDNDGIPDIIEAGGVDTNNDGRVDSATDTDNDGWADTFDSDNAGTALTLLDTDNDGVDNHLDLDSDNDGIEDIIEAGGVDTNDDGRVDSATDTDDDGWADTFDSDNGGTALSNPDTDDDGIKNNLDIDSDGDGIVDLIESQATTGSPVVPGGTDTDGDGIDNAFDTTGGTPTTPVDTDSDGTPDYLDFNSDDDSMLDAVEGWDTDGDKVANTTPTGTDTDGDGLDNAYDDVVGPNATTNVYNNQNANDFPDVTTSGETSERDWREANVIDTDFDGVADATDIDDDNDGILDTDEGCTNNASTPSGAVVASDGTGGSLTLINDEDFASDNGIQLNGAGEYIVVDLGTSIPTGVDIVFTLWKSNDNNKTLRFAQLPNATPNLGGGVNPATVDDTDIAGGGSVTSYTYTLSAETRYVQVEMTSRNGGRIEIIEATIQSYTTCIDTDADEIPDRLDLDSDNDGILDIIEAGGADSNNDGRVDSNTDTDGDGWANTFDSNNGGTALTDPDTDSDGSKNRIDIDSDGDGIVDLIESQATTATPVIPEGSDFDEDGIDNAFDVDCVPCGSVTGVPTVIANTDGTDNPDYLDLDSDNDGLNDVIEAWDTNGSYLPNTTPSGTDADNDGLDNNFDGVTGPNATTNVYNSQTANSFPNITTAEKTTERDWRESNQESGSPGGINTNFLLWVKATNGGTSWRDVSNNYYSVTSSGTPSSGSLINFNPSNSLGGTDYYNTTLSVNAGTYADLTVIAVYQPAANDAGSVWGEDNGSFDRYMLDGAGANENEAVSNGTGTEDNITGLYSSTTTTLSTIVFDEDQSNGSGVFINGGREVNFTADHAVETSNNFQIGAKGDGTRGFSGLISEVIVYNQLLSPMATRQKIESYLAIKYGITLSSDTDGDASAFEAGEGDYLASNGTPFWDASEATSFQNNIAGIARDDASSLNQLQSGSVNSNAIVAMGLDGDTDGLESSNSLNGSSFSNDLSALVWGHDGASLYNQENREFDTLQVKSRLNREWRVQETGTVGTVTVRFKVSGLIGPDENIGTNDESEIVLLVDADGDFLTGASVVSQSFVVDSDGYVNFQTDFTDGAYFTLASGEEYALPITLLSFEAVAEEDQIVLKWTTVREVENSLFRLERSANGIDFEDLGYLDGSGTTNDINHYVLRDNNPLNGKNYYRLIDIDHNGTENASEVIMVSYFENSAIEVKPYPNPIKKGQTLYISLDQAAELGVIRMHQINGTEVQIETKRTGNRLAINAAQISKGVHLLTIVVNGKLLKFKIVVNG
ncbi:LamG-like jellyroll fold domain-containing protein [Roseivirga sp.]|uniref:LamG-like jellyroll fold domain-containing protein n=1 Tax=Roseivirga sp. TaxID=1964215 RepID=UPI002B273500|nr:LamG-like jellyroll fold domain-containing protein [Roseivirga sp.]